MRVSYDELDYSDYSVYTYEDQPFTGMAYENFPNGHLLAEDSYVEGVRQGISKKWYPSGVLYYECYYKYGALHGICREWYENGVLKSDFLYEYGILVKGKSFGEDGNLTKDYHIKDDDPNLEILKKYRSLEGS
jgi:antitoxin component YwqK of YwqJK toxin-antitoxin module